MADKSVVEVMSEETAMNILKRYAKQVQKTHPKGSLNIALKTKGGKTIVLALTRNTKPKDLVVEWKRKGGQVAGGPGKKLVTAGAAKMKGIQQVLSELLRPTQPFGDVPSTGTQTAPDAGSNKRYNITEPDVLRKPEQTNR